MQLKMYSPKKFYSHLYSLFDSTTPLKGDCGKLCSGACFLDSEDEKCGMFIFPYEECMLEDLPFGEIEQSNCEYSDCKTADIFFCNSPCTRNMRPLSCRIFPLTPYVKDGKIILKMNTAAKKMCPIAKNMDLSDLDPDFVLNVRKTINRILKIKDGDDFIQMLSDIEDQYLSLSEKFDKKF